MNPVALLGTLSAALLLAACGGSASGPSSGDGPTVVAGFYPFAYVAERVAGEHASVTNLTQSGAEPHDLELSPRQVAELTEADLVIYEAGFQPALDDTVEENVEGDTLEVTDVAALADTGETDGHDHGDHHGDHHGDDHGSEEGHLDPHIWQDPTRLVPVAEAAADRLADVDPDHADAYRANADALVADLTALDQEFESGLADCDRRTFVTSHSAFGYLAQRYDLELVPIAGLTPDSEPSPARLAELRDLVEEKGVTTIFTERLADPAIARTLAEEAGVEVGVLDPIEGLTDETADEDYVSLMRANLDALARANGCR
jgi:zinc transport system substrate-binding protein